MDQKNVPAWIAYGAATLVVVVFLFFCNSMFEQAQTLPAEAQFRWDRMVMIFNTVQTIATAAAGVLLGTTVQQARVASAEARANKADAQASANQSEASKAAAARRVLSELQPPGQGDGNPTIKALQAVLG
jgi:hypothetical protein